MVMHRHQLKQHLLIDYHIQLLRKHQKLCKFFFLYQYICSYFFFCYKYDASLLIRKHYIDVKRRENDFILNPNSSACDSIPLKAVSHER